MKKHVPDKYEKLKNAAENLVKVSQVLVQKSKLSFTNTKRELLESSEIQSSQILFHTKKLSGEDDAQTRAALKDKIAYCLESIASHIDALSENESKITEPLLTAWFRVDEEFKAVRSSHARQKPGDHHDRKDRSRG